MNEQQLDRELEDLIDRHLSLRKDGVFQLGSTSVPRELAPDVAQALDVLRRRLYDVSMSRIICEALIAYAKQVGTKTYYIALIDNETGELCTKSARFTDEQEAAEYADWLNEVDDELESDEQAWMVREVEW